MTSSSVRDGDTAPLIHVGRQPIYDRNGDVVAYELLFRDAIDAVAASRRTAYATSRVIVSAFTEIGLEHLVGSKACFVNVTREFLVGELPIPFDSSQAALEIVETVEVDDAVVAGVGDLVNRGFTIALDDFVFGTGHERLLDLATYVKIDLLDNTPDVVVETIKRLHAWPHLQLVAERLETEEQLTLAFDLGFSLFQGHVLGRPHVVSAPSLSPSRISRLRLLAALASAEVDTDEAVTGITQDPALSYRLLQATNSAASGLSVLVASVHQAVLLLGLDKIRQWVTLMLLTDLTEATEEQLSTTMTRARICHVIARRVGEHPDAAFTVGLLSGVAELTGQPTAELASQLPLAEDVRSALTDGTGGLGQILNAVRAYEEGRVAELAVLVEPDDVVETYLEAVSWSHQVLDDASVDTRTHRPQMPPAGQRTPPGQRP